MNPFTLLLSCALIALVGCDKQTVQPTQATQVHVGDQKEVVVQTPGNAEVFTFDSARNAKAKKRCCVKDCGDMKKSCYAEDCTTNCIGMCDCGSSFKNELAQPPE